MSTSTLESADRGPENAKTPTVRGFVRRPAWARRVDASGLPPETRDLLLVTVRRTKLRPREKLAVADELIAHFHDADRQGVGAEEARRDFGDAALAAKLIRRAKKRNRGVVSQSGNALRWCAGCLLLFYLVLAVRFFTGTPEVRVDYLARLNAIAATVPEDERAWPAFRRVMAEFELEDQGQGPPLDAEPGSEQWSTLTAFLDEKQPGLKDLQQAMKRPHLGWMASLPGSVHTQRLQGVADGNGAFTMSRVLGSSLMVLRTTSSGRSGKPGRCSFRRASSGSWTGRCSDRDTRWC